MFIKKPRSSDAVEGDTVIIMCEVIGDPKPEVVWLRDFLKVSANLQYIFRHHNTNIDKLQKQFRFTVLSHHNIIKYI